MCTLRAVATLLLCWTQLLATNVAAAEVNVTNPAELKAAVAAKPGDQIVMADGAWSDVDLLLNKPGDVSAPLRLRAKTPGGVILNGSSRLTFAAPYVHVEGLLFKGGALTGVTQNTDPPLDRFKFQPNTFFGNVVQGGTVEYAPAREGFIEKDARLVKGADGIYRPDPNNPATKAGVKPPGAQVVPNDIPPRRDAPGVGAEEFAAPAGLAKPLMPDDVGPQWVKARRKAGEL